MSLPAEYFEHLYAGSRDPWGFGSRWYEARKRALTVASLPRRRYARAFEPGCSIGELTALLATRCDRLLATDMAPAALAEAARRPLPDSVTLARSAVPAEWPDGGFDLIVLSELGYYLGPGDLAEACRRTVGSLVPGGHVVAVHWRPDVPDYPLTGDEVHRVLAGTPGLCPLARYQDRFFTLDVLGRGSSSALEPPEPG